MADFTLPTLLSALLLPPLLVFFWLITSTSPQSTTSSSSTLSKITNVIPNLSASIPSASNIRGKRVVLLIAHPDDEAMFFGPTLMQLTREELGNHVKVLCLSTGNAENLGATRREELHSSALHLGVRKPSDIFIVDDPSRFPDSMTKSWSPQDIASLLAEAFAPDLSKNKASKKGTTNGKVSEDGPPSSTIDVLITFDSSGISSHPNHISLRHGAELFLRQLMRDKSGWRCPISLYYLSTVSLLRKYSFIFDAPLTLALGGIQSIISGSTRNSTSTSRGTSLRSTPGDPDGNVLDKRRLVFIAGPEEYWRIRGAMTNSHKSQMVWFRWGWVSLGRYMVLNELVRGWSGGR